MHDVDFVDDRYNLVHIYRAYLSKSYLNNNGKFITFRYFKLPLSIKKSSVFMCESLR